MELQKFTNDALGVSVRVVDSNGDPWFIARDVCDALDIKNVTDSTRDLDDDERSSIKSNTSGGIQEVLIISESGLYGVISQSRKPEAKPFKRWIRKDVLPSIRKHGAYITPRKLEEIAAKPETIYELAEALVNERKKTDLLTAKEEIFGNRTPYGTISEQTGNPRVTPVHGYLRSNSRGIEFVPDIIQLQLFEPGA